MRVLSRTGAQISTRIDCFTRYFVEYPDSPAPSSTTSTTPPTRRPQPKDLRIVIIYQVILTAAISPEALSLNDRVSTTANRLEHALAP